MSLSQDFDFSGRRVLVTGAANGLGAAIAAAFAAQGATLVRPTSRRSRCATSRAGSAPRRTFSTRPIRPRWSSWRSPLGPSTSSSTTPALVAKPLLETSLEEVRRLIDIDFVGVVRLMQLVARRMVERRRGVIVSMGSQTAFSGGENRAVYAAVKAAVSQLTRAAAVEWGPYGVRVVCLAPGRSLTRMTRETARPGYAGDRGLARVPLGRWGTPEEIAKMVVFLASDAASYVTGETLIADGGYVIG
jgi:NAD(P)-dependent dehydrogenase (short-subunit alcohol dehydrogenase family)